MINVELEQMDGTTTNTLVVVSERLEPYVLSVGSPEDQDGQVETLSLVVMRRSEAFLLAIPEGALDAEFLEEGSTGGPESPFGPYTMIEVPGVVLDGGAVSPTGTMLRVVLVDCLNLLAESLRSPTDGDGVVVVFDADDPNALPAPDALLAAATNWIAATGGEGRVAYYSAESVTPVTTPRRSSRPKKKPAPAGATPTGDGVPKPKRPTTASLAESVEGLMSSLPNLTAQVSTLLERQKALESQMSLSQTRSILSRPLGGSLDLPPGSEPEKPRSFGIASGSEAQRSFGVGSGEGSSGEWRCPGQGRLCTVPSTYSFGGSDCFSTGGSSQRALSTQRRSGLKGSCRSSQASRRIGTTPGCLLPVSFAKHGEEDGTHFTFGELYSGHAGPRSVGNKVPRTFRGIREASGARPHPIPSHDGDGSSHGQQHWRGSGHHCSSSCHVRTDGVGWWSNGSGWSSMPTGRCSIERLHESSAGFNVPSSKFCSFSRPKMDHSCPAIPSRDGLDCYETPGVCRNIDSFGKWARAGARRPPNQAKGKAEVQTTRTRQRRTATRRGGGLKELHPGGQEPSPLDAKIDFLSWAICLPRWILRCRTPFSWALRKTFTADWVKPALPTAVFPLPVPHPYAWKGGGPCLSRRRMISLAFKRLLNIIVAALNYQYLGRAATFEEIGRCPNTWQRSCFGRLRTLIAACGTDPEPFSLAPGRSGPELGAALFQLEQFAELPEVAAGGYKELFYQRFFDDPLLFPEESYPQLRPYRSLDSSRLKLTGSGRWNMQKHMDGELWLPFVEPRFLLHDQMPDPDDIPAFSKENYEENLKLIRLWDSKGLLELFEEPIEEGFYSRVFNAFKNETTDRQIGDRRYGNQRERHILGPSRYLPQGPQLVCFQVRRFREKVLGSITDRRDFYHQAAVSTSRAQSNLLPFRFDLPDLAGTSALEAFEKNLQEKRGYRRDLHGDRLGVEGGPTKRKRSLPAELYGGFKSLFQGITLGLSLPFKPILAFYLLVVCYMKIGGCLEIPLYRLVLSGKPLS